MLGNLYNDDDELSCEIADQRKCVKRLLLLRKVLFEPLTIAAKYSIWDVCSSAGYHFEGLS